MDSAFERFAFDVHGEAGAAWSRRVAGLLRELSSAWGLTLGPQLPGAQYGYVVGVNDAVGEDAVLKLAFPGPETDAEIRALRLMDGVGVVRLIRADEKRGALLLERALPGRQLREICAQDDAEATRRAAEVMWQIRRPLPSPHSFPVIETWLLGLERLHARAFGEAHPFGQPFVRSAVALVPELLASAAEPVLLHGDLHHDNIVSAERLPWLAIDPKGVAGEPAYEAGALLRNPLPWLLEQADPAAVLSARLDILSAELRIDRERLRAWGQVQAVLAAWWGYEDHDAVNEPFLTCASLLDGLGR